MDRALSDIGNWSTETGYYVKPKLIYRDQWISNDSPVSTEHPFLLKLHGSTNWLTSYMIAEEGKLNSIQNTNIDEVYVYESNRQPYYCYAGRYMDGYTDFSYGYYPPNLPVDGKPLPEGFLLSRTIIAPASMPPKTSEDKGLNSMPLIIPPVKYKNYDHFGTLFEVLSQKAEESLTNAEKIVIIGYSFPITDTQTDQLFKKSFSKRRDMPTIIIVNPEPELIVERFIYNYGIHESKIFVYKQYFTAEMDCQELFN